MHVRTLSTCTQRTRDVGERIDNDVAEAADNSTFISVGRSMSNFAINSHILIFRHMERIILLRYLNIYLHTGENNFTGLSK